MSCPFSPPSPPQPRCLCSLALVTRAHFTHTHARFEFKGKDPKFRIETPSRVIHSLKTPVSQEISGMQKIQIKSALVRVVKRFGVSPPQKVRVMVTGGAVGLSMLFVLPTPPCRSCFPSSNKSLLAGAPSP